MSERKIVVEEGEASRVDKLVAKATGLGRSAVKRLFEEGHVRVGRRRVDKGEVLVAGTELSVTLPDHADDGALPDDSPLEVLLERADLVVVDKPPRRPTAPLRPGETGTIANALAARYPEMRAFGHHAREPGLVHRLDNDTSGVLVAARTKPAWDELVQAMKDGALDKQYLALVEDDDMPDTGTVDVPLAPHPKDQRRVLACLHPRDVAREKPRAARSDYRVIARGDGVALVEVSAPRALRHQVRAHLAVLRCPIVADTLYGAKPREDLDRHALHAARVTYGGGPVVPAFDVESPLPADLVDVAARAGISPVSKSLRIGDRMAAMRRALFCLSLFVAVGCGSSSSDTPSNGAAATGAGGTGNAGAGGAGGGATRALAATKCTYDTTPRMEYTDVFAPKTDADLAKQALGAAPTPLRIRLGLGGNVTPGDAARVDAAHTVAIAWETDLETTATTVEYGASPDPSTWTAKVDGFSYVVPEGKAAIGGSDIRMHEAHLCGLDPKTTYYYRVGGGPAGKEVWSDVVAFHTLSASADDKVTIAVTGDSRGENNNAWQILQGQLKKRGDIDLQLFSGDMIDLATDQKAYAKWLDSAEKGVDGKRSALGSVLSLLAMGNHEAYSSPFFATVVQPQDPAGQGKFSELFFSLEVGAAHVIVLDDFAIGSPSAMSGYRDKALAWLKADLDAAVKDRAAHPWIIAVHHHGEWTSSSHADDKDVLEVRKTLVPMWDEAAVDLVLDGHDHNYERSKKLKLGADGKPVLGAGTTYVVCAGSGADGYGSGSSAWTEKTFEYTKGAAIGAYGVMTVEKSKLSFVAHALTAAGDDPVQDQFELTK